MGGEDRSSGGLFSYVDIEGRVPGDHPLRVIRGIVNDVPSGLSWEFEQLYSPTGRPSIPPEQLVRALLLQAFYSIRSERQPMERLDFDMLYRRFVGSNSHFGFFVIFSYANCLFFDSRVGCVSLTS